MGQVLKTFVKLILGRGQGSQFGEDKVVAQLLPGKRGFYVDVGAYHPHLYSNTWLFYKRGWRGVAIDPSPDTAKLFWWFRPGDKFVRSGVGEVGSGIYHMYEDGAYNGFGLAVSSKVRLTRTLTTKIRPLRDLIPRGQPIDFLSVDVEGMDLEVLETLDWSFPPKVIAIEGEESSAFLVEKGYIRIQKCGETVIWKR